MNTNTMSDAMQTMEHSYAYAARQIKRDTGHGETLPLYDTQHSTCLDYACWVAENYPDGDCDHSLHFWSWLNATHA